MAALGSQTIAASYEQLLHVDADGGGNSTTHVSVKDGDNGTTFGFTIASDALMMSSTNRLEFGDTGTYIHQSADGVLDLVSDTEIEINATTIDINGAVDMSSTLEVSDSITVSSTNAFALIGRTSNHFVRIEGDGSSAYISSFNDGSASPLQLRTYTGSAYTNALQLSGANATFSGDIIIDADDKALVLGADQDVSIFANAPGEMFITRGTDITPVTGDTEGWFALACGDSGASYLQIFGGETGDALLYMYADNGDDDVDKWRMKATTGGDFIISGAASGSFVDFVGISSAGHMVKNKQAAFMAYPSSTQSDIANDSNVEIAFGTERFDQGSNFASNTFTAPATGKYQLNVSLEFTNMDSAATYYQVNLATSNDIYYFYIDPDFGQDTAGSFTVGGSVLADMDTNDTAVVQVRTSDGTAQMDVATQSFFSGFLAC